MSTCLAVRFTAESENLRPLARRLLTDGLPVYASHGAIWICLSEPAPNRLAFSWATDILAEENLPGVRIKLLPAYPKPGSFAQFKALRLKNDGAMTHRVITAGAPRVCYPLDAAPLDLPRRFDPSVFGSKDRLVERYGDRIAAIREHPEGFARWDGRHWRPKASIQDLYERLSQTAEREGLAILREVTPLLDAAEDAEDAAEIRRLKRRLDHGRDVVAYAHKMRSTYHYDGTVKRLHEDHRIVASIAEYDQDPSILNTPSGIVDLASGSLIPHDPERRCISMTRAPYREDVEAPTWDLVISRVSLGEEDFAHYMQIRLGSALWGHNPEQIAVLAYGEHGEGGKSTVLETVNWALGDYARSASPDTFLQGHRRGGNRDDLVTLAGSRLVTTSEPDSAGVIDVGTFKRMTGDDSITAAAKYERTRSFEPTWKILMAANEYPALKESGNPVWRRFEVMPFDYQIKAEDKDPNIKAKLRAESSGILRWLVEGCRLWVAAGFKTELPPRAVKALERYKREADSVRAWRIYQIEPSEEHALHASIAYERYQSWCRDNGRKPTSLQGWGRRMRALEQEHFRRHGKEPWVKRTVKGSIVYQGIRIRES